MDASAPIGQERDNPWSRDEFETQLRAKGSRYHIHHPFHIAMNRGECTREQVQGWVINRFFYQTAIPLKDAAIMSNCPDRNVRREWIQRIVDHDGRADDEGGIEAWLRLGEAVGVKREEMASLKHVLPGVRFAVEAYVNFARTRPWQESVTSSLTELFAPEIHQKRLDEWTARKEQLEARLARQIPEMNLEQKLRKAGHRAVASALEEASPRGRKPEIIDRLRAAADDEQPGRGDAQAAKLCSLFEIIHVHRLSDSATSLRPTRHLGHVINAPQVTEPLRLRQAANRSLPLLVEGTCINPRQAGRSASLTRQMDFGRAIEVDD